VEEQPIEDRREKRRYRQWQHDDWNTDYRQLIPEPEADGYTELMGWGGTVLKRIPDMTGDYLTWCREPWKL
jgi:hypothetical protein